MHKGSGNQNGRIRLVRLATDRCLRSGNWSRTVNSALTAQSAIFLSNIYCYYTYLVFSTISDFTVIPKYNKKSTHYKYMAGAGHE